MEHRRATRKSAYVVTHAEPLTIDGFLERREEGDLLLEHAVGRDSKAPFNPIE